MIFVMWSKMCAMGGVPKMGEVPIILTPVGQWLFHIAL